MQPNILSAVKPSCDMDAKGSTAATLNHLFFYRGVDDAAVCDLNAEIVSCRSALDHLTKGLGVNQAQIHLHINSCGGSTWAGLASASVIQRNNIHTHVEGSAASAATMMSVAGAHRTVERNAFMLIHQLSWGFWGKYGEMDDWKKSADKVAAAIFNHYRQFARIPEKKLKAILAKDLWLTAAEALEFGLVDEII